MENELKEVLLSIANCKLIDKVVAVFAERRKIDMRVLFALHRSTSSLTPSNLAKECNVSTPRMTVLLQRLQFMGFCKSKRSKEDARKIEITLTKKGSDRINKNEQNLNAIVHRMLEKMTKEESRQFIDICHHLLEEKRHA